MISHTQIHTLARQMLEQHGPAAIAQGREGRLREPHDDLSVRLAEQGSEGHGEDLIV